MRVGCEGHGSNGTGLKIFRTAQALKRFEGHGSNGTGLKIFRTAQAQKCFVLSEPRSQIFFTIETVLSLCRLSHAVWAWNDLSI